MPNGQEQPVLVVNDVHSYYGDSHVLQGVTLHAERGTVTAVLGRNGVGKTTLCRTLTGLTPARTGRLLVKGVEITRLPPHRIAAAGLSLVPQGRRLFSSLTVEEHLAVAHHAPLLRGHPEPGTETAGRSHHAHWDLDKVFAVFPRLAERRHHRGTELSGGEQQMLAIARALVANPVLLVMDEPTEGLAPALVRDVAHLIRRLRDEGTSLLLVEQNAAFAVKAADYVHVMSGGRIVLSSTPQALWEDDALRTQWLGVPGGA